MKTQLIRAITCLLASGVIGMNAAAQTGSADAFDPNADWHAYACAVQPDGKVLVAGPFTHVGGVARPAGIARLNADGTLDTGFDPPIIGGTAQVYALAALPDGKVLIAGSFNGVGAYPIHRLARLNADGTPDTTFSAEPNSIVSAMALLPDGKIMILGAFTSLASGLMTREHVARLNADGSVDASFIPPPNTGLTCLAMQTDGKVIVGGYGTIGGVARTVARLNADGTLDPAFAEPGVNSVVDCLTLQPDGKAIIGGGFTHVVVSRPGLARLNADGTRDDGFAPTLTGNTNGVFVSTAALQTNGQVIIGGQFASVNSVTRNRIARLQSGGALETSFNPNSGGNIWCSALQADGKAVVSGVFQHESLPHLLIGGAQRNRIARLFNDGATSVLTINSQNTVTWERGGTSPEAAAVMFELSSDGGSTWSTLGNAARVAGGWQLVGLSLPLTGIVRGNAIVPVPHESGTSSSLMQTTRTYAFAPAAEVVTQPTTNPAATSATLNASVDANGGATTALFQYGTTTSYGSTAPVTLVPDNSSAPLSVNASVIGLTAHVVYHCRIVATNTSGTSYGEDVTFVSNATPSAPVLSASSIAENQPVGTTIGTLGPATDSDGEPVTYTLVAGNGDSDNFSFAIVGNTLRTNESLNFEWQTSYSVRVRASDGFLNGSSESALSVTVTNVLEPPTITAQPATGIRHTSAALQALVNPHTVFTSAQFEYGLTTSYGSTRTVFFFPADDSSDHAVQAFVGALQPGTTYHYRLTASSADGSTQGADQTFTTRATSPGDVEIEFAPEIIGGAVQCTAVQPDGKILIGGYFTQVNGVPRNNLARLNQDGTLDAGFDPSPDNVVNCIAVQLNGNILIGGFFAQVGTTPKANLARLTPAGAVDATFTPSVNGSVNVMLVDELAHTLYIAGSFTDVGLPRVGLACLQDNGIIDTSFPNMAPNGPVNALALGGYWLPELFPFPRSYFPQLIIGGAFSSIGGNTAHGIARFYNGSVVDSLIAAAPGTIVFSLARVTDGILIGGSFSTIGGEAHVNLARCSLEGVIQGYFNPDIAGSVYCMATQADGKILVGGLFSEVNGTPASNLSRLNSNGTLDTSFDPGVRSEYFYAAVTSVSLQPDGRVLTTGNFSHLGGEPRNGFARLSNGPASRSFGFTSWNATWTLTGTSPAVGEVWLEYSPDQGASWLPWRDLSFAVAPPPGTALWQRTIPPTAPRLWRVWGRIDGGSASLSNEIVHPTGSITNWRLAYFGSTADSGSGADAADPDHDGLVNLLEYAFGLSPISAAGGIPAGHTSGSGAGAVFEIRFTQPAGITGITYGAEWRPTLGGSSTPVPDTGVFPEHVFSVPIAGESRGFMSIVVTRAP